MNFESLDTNLRSSQALFDLKARWVGVMEGGLRRNPLADGRRRDYKPLTRANSWKSFPSNYFSVESFLVLFCLTASLLLLPLILPPLPPPPFMLLLVPIGIFVVLLILAFMPSDVRDIASSYA